MSAQERSLERIEVAGQELRVFVETGPLFEAMLADIRQAQQRVWLETYIFASDDIGSAIAEALKKHVG